jgi:hypothetical protein
MTHKVNIVKLNFFDPYIVNDPKCRDQRGSDHWAKRFFFFFIFLHFERDTTNYRGTLVENVRKSKINPPYCTPLLLWITKGKKVYMVRYR